MSDVKYPLQVPIEDLRWKCPEDIVNFNSTVELNPLDTIVGQPRAIDAIRMGINLQAPGYNIFVTGLSGTGRTSTVKRIVEQHIERQDLEKCDLSDLCYVNNFNDPDKPILIRFKAGEVKHFKKAIDSATAFLKDRLPKLFEEDAFQNARKLIFEKYKEIEEKVLNEFDEKLKTFGFIRGQLDIGNGAVQPEVFPKIETKPYQIEELDALVEQKQLTAEKLEEYKKYYLILHDELAEIVKSELKLMRQMQEEVFAYDKGAASIPVDSIYDEIAHDFPIEKVKNYLTDVKTYILEHLPLFVKQPDAVQDGQTKKQNAELFLMFTVNIIIDNSDATTRPIIVETNPTYSNLFGDIDKSFDSRGFWHSDFTKISAGSLLRADKGYLIVNAQDLFIDPAVWNALKRVILYDKLEIQPFDNYLQGSPTSVKPEPILVKVKIIIIGGMTMYNLLYNYEKGFKKMFKVLAQFDSSTEYTDDLLHSYSRYISKICFSEHLPHASKDGAAAIIEWAVESAGSQTDITLRFSDVADIIRESAYFAGKAGRHLIERDDVDMAVTGRSFRNGLLDEKISESIIDGDILIDTQGKRVGQINGLTVYSTGLFSFGKPARITASICAGTKGIINIEREANMSGSIHNKGVLIISGFLNNRFGKTEPLSLTASLAFEQSYGGIDGDSASVAEIYVLLSAIAEVPINQEIAITGSINQKGDVQPIGGVNEKVTGYYEICKSRGLTGKQCVIIPRQNIKDLMLRKDTIEDIKNGLFNIYAMDKIEDATELVFGIKAGELDKNGKYPSDSLFGLVVNKLDQFRKSTHPKRERIKKEIETKTTKIKTT